MTLLDDLTASIGSIGRSGFGHACERCHDDTATLRLRVQLAEPTPPNHTYTAEQVFAVWAFVCERCGVDIATQIGEAVGKIRRSDNQGTPA